MTCSCRGNPTAWSGQPGRRHDSMDAPLTAASLFEIHGDRLGLRWEAGRQGASRAVQVDGSQAPEDSPFGAWVGHLNLIHPNRIQVLGPAEMHYLDELGKNSHADTVKQLFDNRPACVVISDGLEVAQELKRMAERTATPLFSSNTPGHKIISHLQYYVSDSVADAIVLHGVFMEIMGIGVLLTGKSGVGKSELALELINRHHRLIADDAPKFRRIPPDTLNGTCPSGLSGFLEVRGIGVLNVRVMFGDSAIKSNKNLRLIIHLQRMNDEELAKIDRLQGSRQERTILEVDVPQVTLPVAPGHNLAVLAEGAVRNHILLFNGYNAAQDFVEKQQRLIREGGA